MKKNLYIAAGCLSLVLGIIGIFVPVLPTTPFLLLTAWLWLRSSQRLYDWLMSHPHLGKYIRDYMENKAAILQGQIEKLIAMDFDNLAVKETTIVG